MDRFFDLHVMAARRKPAFEAIRGDGSRRAAARDEVRLLAWLSFARGVEEGQRFRRYFPLGAPGRD